MTLLTNFWDLIIKSNAFNFILLLVIIAFVIKKANLSAIIEKMKEEIITLIENSKKAKEDAENKYEVAKEKIKNIDNEIEEQISIAKQQAMNVAHSIEESKNRRLKQLENNAQKTIEAEEKNITTSLNDSTAIKAVNLAEKCIIKKIQEDPSLHNKYIDECIDELEKAVF